MSVYDDVRKGLQNVLAPEIQEIKGELRAINVRLDAIEKLIDIRFQQIIEKLDFDRRLDRIEEKQKSAN